ncbi:MAG TPA: cupredoxin domain-containing protein [Roseiflexaceae bacterium]
METSIAVTRTRNRLPLAALGKLSVAGLVGLALALIYLQAAMIGTLVPPLAVFTVISLVVTGVVMVGWRWAPLLGALWSILMVVGNTDNIVYSLTHPAEFRSFVFVVFLLAMALIGVSAGIAATVQNYRGGQRLAPSSLPVALATLVGVAAGAILVAAVAGSSENAGVSSAALAKLPALKTANFAFDQAEIRVKAGETVALRLENSDTVRHRFDVDEFGVHAPIPSGQSSLALFKPEAPGTYTFYCAPHYDKATGEGMKGTLIVD